MRITFPQSISVLRLLAEDKHGSVDEVMSIDVGSLMYTLAECIDRGEGPVVTRIKIKYCALAKSISERTDILCMRKEEAVRNAIVDKVMEWLRPVKVRLRLFVTLLGELIHRPSRLR